MNAFWNHCLQQFEQELPSQQFKTWIEPLRVEGGDSENETLRIIAPNAIKLKWIRDRYLSRIQSLSAGFFSFPLSIDLQIEEKSLQKNEIKTSHSSEFSKEKPKEFLVKKEENKNELIAHHSISKKNNPAYAQTRLISDYTFDTLVVGKANDLARAAAVRVSENPGSNPYNPLFIYGGAGLGKTHLIHAIGNRILEVSPEKKIRYSHAEDYIQSIISTIKSGSFDSFKQLYRSLDVFLLDDVQFFNRKEGSQNEFFFVFNTLIQEGKQIVITCDTYPKDISGLGDRLITRFDWGLTVQIEPPELEMRVAIIKKKAELSGILIQDDIAFYIAKHLKSNVRELEGALNKVLAYASFHEKKIGLELAKEALKDIIGAVNRQITITDIQATVAEYFKIKVSDLFSKKRTRQIARPRQVAMWLAKSLTADSYPTIGESFGGRDHTTVLHAVRTIDGLKAKDHVLNHDVHFLLQTLKGSEH